jgi:hypothetical protein
VSELEDPEEVETLLLSTEEMDRENERMNERRCPDCGYTEGHTEVCAGFDRNDPGRTGE